MFSASYQRYSNDEPAGAFAGCCENTPVLKRHNMQQSRNSIDIFC